MCRQPFKKINVYTGLIEEEEEEEEYDEELDNFNDPNYYGPDPEAHYARFYESDDDYVPDQLE